MIIVSVTAMPYAAAIAPEERKPITITTVATTSTSAVARAATTRRRQPTINAQLTRGT